MKKYISWKDYHRLLVGLYFKIKSANIKFSYIVGIENGGLNLSVPLANEFNCPHKSLKISFYDDNIKKDIPVIESNLTFNEDDYFLLVDDIVDSGSTIFEFSKYTKMLQHKNFLIVTLHWNPNGVYKIRPDFFCQFKEEIDWIVYPWEM